MQPRGVGRADVDPGQQRAGQIAHRQRRFGGLGETGGEGEPLAVLETVREDAGQQVLRRFGGLPGRPQDQRLVDAAIDVGELYLEVVYGDGRHFENHRGTRVPGRRPRVPLYLSGHFPSRAQLGERVEEHRELVPVGDERVAVRRAADELEADAVGVGEEGRVVVGVVLRVVLRRGGVDAELAQRRGGRIDVGGVGTCRQTWCRPGAYGSCGVIVCAGRRVICSARLK